MADTSDLQSKLQNLSPEDMVRGKTPEGIEKRCLALCQRFIGAQWNRATGPEDVKLRRISGGFSNQLYDIELASHLQDEQSNQPNRVTIKLYMGRFLKSYYEKSERLNDVIISSIASEANLGPRMYGIFEDGVVQGYYEHDQFRREQQKDESLLRTVLHKLAHINHLNVPIPKNRYWMLDEMHDSFEFAYNNFDIDSIVTELKLPKLTSLRAEFEWFEQYMRGLSNTPTVFCHNDFRGSNVMVLKNAANEGRSVVVVDYEYSSYGLRGYDLGSLLAEWDRDLFDFSPFQMPEPEVIQRFARFYLEGCDLVQPGYSTKPDNKLADVVRDIKLGLLFNCIFFIGLILVTRETVIESVPINIHEQLKSIALIFDNYLTVKQSMIKDGTITID